MAYRPQRFGPGKLLALVFAVGVQAALIYGLSTGLLQKVTSNALQEIEATVLPPQEKPKEAPPPPPPPVEAPPPFIPPPDITLDAPPSASAPTQIQRTTPAGSGIVYPKPGRSCGLPDYPATEKRAGHEGKVTISLCVAVDGTVSNVQIKQSSGWPALDSSALAWAQKCRWSPAKIAGQTQSICYDQPYRFQLKNQ